ncbi:DUF2309 domain-containing protein [Azonexus sp. IMCC34839]|uniref:DUF2309 domain-containing protein n=1 Tax=Azonexus sp. IMCC34839 TaxID=3133695 RepID=UPI00399AE3FF
MDERELSLRERLAHWVEHLTHVLPAQAPIRDFVHHNTLHGFQHLPFADALAAAHALTGAGTYWPEQRFRDCLARGRVSRDDLAAALADFGLAGLDEPVAGLARRDILLASLIVGNERPDASRLAWLHAEGGLADDPVFAHFARCTAAVSAGSENDWRSAASQRWAALCAKVGQAWTWRSLLEHLSGEDVLEKVRSILQRHLAAHLDLGLAAWRNPRRSAGFYAAWKASAGLDVQWELDELPNVRDEILHLPGDPLAVLAEELPRLVPETLWHGYLERLALELPGWSGMFLWRERNPGRGDGTPVAMADYLAVRVLLERLLCDDLARRLTGAPMDLSELQAHYGEHLAEFFVRDAWRQGGLAEAEAHRAAGLIHGGEKAGLAVWTSLAEGIAGQATESAALADAWRLAALSRELPWGEADTVRLEPATAVQLLACADSLSPLQRGQIWLEAYERHYREQIFSALVANRRLASPSSPSAQVVMCMDDREEGTRRHLEEIAPSVHTYGAAGFFGVPMYWQGIDDAKRTALCPVVVQPRHLLRERELAGEEKARVRHAIRRERRLRWREALYQKTRRTLFGGTAFSMLAGLPALGALAAVSLNPAVFGESLQRWRERHDGRVDSEVALTALEASEATPESPQLGFTDAEQIDRVEGFLRTIGLTAGFAPLVLMFGHGSSSRNNPHLSAYDCGACSGRHGGPNARVFAAMANRAEVRAGLAVRGIVVPESTWFVAAEHNTCDDGVEWYDLDTVPDRFQAALDTLVGQIAEACRAHAAERCRRLASAPPRLSPWQGRRHVTGRAHDISQARPELGHATNAAAFIGRRSMSRGLFLDRRVFLISYDPTDDIDGQIVESILLAAGPVGAGISLEYYFSTVDNERFGCGSKITHNLTGLFGVMEGADSDLRTGLPLQMVEIHEPMRLLVVVEQEPELLDVIVQRQPALRELIDNGWIVFASQSPCTAAVQLYRPGRGWQPWAGDTVLPQVARSVDWFAGESEALPPAQLLGGVA